HTYVMTREIGRNLRQDEVVHHIDRDRQNNVITNLMLLTKSEHAALHQREDNGASPPRQMACKQCSKVFVVKSKTQNCCSLPCSCVYRRKFEVTKEELQRLVWEKTVRDIAADFGVSVVAIHKKCKTLGVT